MELPELGARCHAVGCSQLDFLPFRCSYCSGKFCLEHRMPSAHACSGGGGAAGEVDIVLCPICARAIKVPHGQDPNVAWAQHASKPGECDPANYNRVHKKQRCGARHCKEKLSLANRFECKDCGALVCLKHRFGPDHECEERQKRIRELRAQARSFSWRIRAPRGNSKTPGGAKGTCASSCVIC